MASPLLGRRNACKVVGFVSAKSLVHATPLLGQGGQHVGTDFQSGMWDSFGCDALRTLGAENSGSYSLVLDYRPPGNTSNLIGKFT